MRSTVAKISGLIGMLTLILGALVFLIAPSLLLLRGILVLMGVALLTISVVLDFGGAKRLLKLKSTRANTYTTVLTLAVIGILVCLNFMAFKHNYIFDFSEGKIHTLSDQTSKVARQIKSPLTVYGFLEDADRTGFEEVMKRYKLLNPLINYRFVNPNIDIKLTKKFEVKTFGTVVVESAGRHFLIEEKFTEESLTNTLLKFQKGVEKRVAFLVGHQERSIFDDSINGESQFKSTLVGQGYVVTELNLLSSTDSIKDISLIVIPGMKQKLFDHEIELLSTFIANNGSILILQDPQNEEIKIPFTKEWGIEILNGTIIDPDAQVFSGGAEIPLVGKYGDHIVTRDLNKAHLRTLFPISTALKINQKLDGYKVTPLAFTSPRSWLESKVAEHVKFDPPLDIKGPLIIGAITESKKGKLIYFGDSDFSSNQFFLNGANRNLLVNLVRYAVDESDIISILPREAKFHQILLSNKRLQLIKFFAGIFIPFGITFGGLRMWRRRRRL